MNGRPHGFADTFLDMYGGNLPDTGLGQALLSEHGDPSLAAPAVTLAAPGGPDPILLHQAMTAYGETGGVYPQMAPGKTGIYDPASYDPASAAQLQLARAWLARVRLVNPTVHEKAAPGANPIEQRAWQGAMDGAMAAKDIPIPDGVSHFYLRQGPMPAKAPPWAKQKPIKTFGPFINTGGGDVPKGPNMYIDFFGGN